MDLFDFGLSIFDHFPQAISAMVAGYRTISSFYKIDGFYERETARTERPCVSTRDHESMRDCASMRDRDPMSTRDCASMRDIDRVLARDHESTRDKRPVP